MRISKTTLGSVLFLMLLVLAAPLAAQVQVGIGFGHGGHGHHGHHGHHGWHGHGWYGFGWYPGYAYRPYDYVYVAPPVVVAPPPVVYAPAVSAAAPTSSMQLPIAATSPATTTAAATSAARRNSLPVKVARQVVIRNSADSTAKVFFTVDGVDSELVPGQMKILNDKSSCLVEFDRGGDFGTATHELNPGTHEFVVTGTGWELQQPSEEPQRAASRVVRKNALPQ